MNYEEMLKQRNEKNIFARENGIQITELREGYAKVTMEVTSKHMNPIGSVHGGCLFTIADVTAGAAASSYGKPVTTVDANIHYLRAGMNTSYIYGEATELKRGKKVLTYAIHVKDQNDRVLAHGIFTYMILEI